MRTRTMIASLALAAGSLILAAPAAQADSCSGNRWKGTTWTEAVSYSPACNSRARIDRYVNGIVYSYYGAWETEGNYSFTGYHSNGTNAGNAWALGPSGWIWF